MWSPAIGAVSGSNPTSRIGHQEAPAWAMKSMTTYADAADGLAEADRLQQIVELLGELDPRTRSARCAECGASQFIYCEEVNMQYRLTNADATSLLFGGDG